MERIRYKKARELKAASEFIRRRCTAVLSNPRGGFMSEDGTYKLPDGRYMQVFRDSFGFEHGLIGDDLNSTLDSIKGGAYDRWMD